VGLYPLVFNTAASGLDKDIVANSMNRCNLAPFTIITLDLDITRRGTHNFHELASAALTYRKNGEEWELIYMFIYTNLIRRKSIR